MLFPSTNFGQGQRAIRIHHRPSHRVRDRETAQKKVRGRPNQREMPRRNRKGFTGAVPLSFVAIPAVGAVAFGLRSGAAPSRALLHAPSRSSMIDSQLMSSRRFGERVRGTDEYPSVGSRWYHRHRDGSAAQV